MHRLKVATCACFLVFAPCSAFAAWSESPRHNVPVCVLAGHQQYPQCVSDGAGGAIVAWQDGRTGIYDIYAQHVLASGQVDPLWPVLGRRVCGAASDQGSPVVVTDNAGGAIIVWYDLRNGPLDIYAHRVLASGTVDPTWPADGLAVCDTAGDQVNPRVAPDGSGGAYVTWGDGRGPSIDIYAHHILVNGTLDSAYPAKGVPVCTATGTQSWPMIVPDGFGGALLTWYDRRNGTDNDIFAHHLAAAYSVDPTWPTDGVAVCTFPGEQSNPALTPDEAGGAIIAWHDLRDGTSLNIFAQHVMANGITDPAWPVGGMALCTMLGEQSAPQLATDGASGAYVVWQDWRIGGAPDVYVQHLLSGGVPDPSWVPEGQALIVASGNQNIPRIVPGVNHDAFVVWQDARFLSYDALAQHIEQSGVDPEWIPGGVFTSGAPNNQLEEQAAPDGSGGAIVVWQDFRNGSWDVYAEHVDPSGPQWDPNARIAGVRDVLNDQGGKVKVSWTASFLEDNSNTPLRDYVVLRSIPDHAVHASGARILEHADDVSGAAGSVLLHTRTGMTDYYWEYLATVTPLHLSGYSYVASTTSDSVAGSNPKTIFAILSRAGSWTFQSAADSGYSVDNLAPPPPTSFTATYDMGSVRLRWEGSTVADFGVYRLHRGGSADFVPDDANLVGTTTDTVLVDTTPGPGGHYYKIAALDVHGNASLYADASPGGALAVGDGPRTDIASWRILHNPVDGRSIEFVGTSLAGESVGVRIVDIQGRVVFVHTIDIVSAGRATLGFGGTGLPPGVYLADLSRTGRHVTRRFVVVR